MGQIVNFLLGVFAMKCLLKTALALSVVSNVSLVEASYEYTASNPNKRSKVRYRHLTKGRKGEC